MGGRVGLRRHYNQFGDPFGSEMTKIYKFEQC
jgi:hypothetical protein